MYVKAEQDYRMSRNIQFSQFYSDEVGDDIYLMGNGGPEM